VRHLAAHAPAGPADFAAWSGLGLTEARSALASIRNGLVEVATEQGPLWTLRSPRHSAERGLVRLLPAFDEYLMGWKDRRLIARPDDWAAVNRGGGWLHPVLLSDGRVVATWRLGRMPESLAVEVAPFATLAPEVRRGTEAEAEHLAAFLGNPAKLTILTGPTAIRRR
jgi:winged helix DNA-binding protein